MQTFSLQGQLVDIPKSRIYAAEITVEKGIINSIAPISDNKNLPFLLPGFIDAHVHVESSMLVPSEFARLAVVHGTVATVSDPHEIANVCGMEGVEFMIENGKKVPFHFYFGAPSCVPATPFETAGAEITASNIDDLLGREEILYLAEMMNWPGTVNRDPDVMEKIRIAQKHGKPIDGHAPGLMGDLAAKYISAGISTDHECFTYEEALEKIKQGMKIIIREGSAAKNFEALIDLIDDYPEYLMFCSDDKHPDNLAIGHINELAARAVAKGKNLFDILTAACLNPIEHYGLQVGQLRVNDPADFILVENLEQFKVLQTYIKGQLVAENGLSLIKSVPVSAINNFHLGQKKPTDFQIRAKGTNIRVIEALDGQLVTPEKIAEGKVIDGFAVSDTDRDILKIAVVNRYKDSVPAIGFITNFGLNSGAIASSVGHDSHNVIAVGVDDESICRAVNLLVASKGGISAVIGETEMVLTLPVGGIMSDRDGYEVAEQYTALDQFAKSLGSRLQSPFMTLSFMALLVIPELKLSDKGLFDGKGFRFADVFVE
jgi:adenine deaminase